jgi:hypothetical protein
MEVSAVSSIAGAAGRTEGKLAGNTLAEVSLTALVHQSAVLALLWEVVAVATGKEILEDGEASLVVGPPRILTGCSSDERYGGRHREFPNCSLIDFLPSSLKVEGDIVEKLEDFQNSVVRIIVILRH